MQEADKNTVATTSTLKKQVLLYKRSIWRTTKNMMLMKAHHKHLC